MPTSPAALLRAELESARPPVPSQGFPLDLKLRVGAYTRTARVAGKTWTGISKEMGISGTTLAIWAKLAPEEPIIRPVVLVEAFASPAVSLVSPGGFRLEGLELGQAILLFKAL